MAYDETLISRDIAAWRLGVDESICFQASLMATLVAKKAPNSTIAIIIKKEMFFSDMIAYSLQLSSPVMGSISGGDDLTVKSST